MITPHLDPPPLPERTRLAACLLHSIPGVSGSVEVCHGARYLVAHHRPDATLTPCELRAGLLQPCVPGVPHLGGMVRSIELTGGAVDLGGGLYRHAHPSVDERWFVTVLDADVVTRTAAECPESLDQRSLSVRVRADLDLAVCAVCVSADQPVGERLDDVARWLLDRCLVDELIEPARTSPAR